MTPRRWVPNHHPIRGLRPKNHRGLRGRRVPADRAPRSFGSTLMTVQHTGICVITEKSR